uniref:Uncharacterized protein n=1 Tax=Cucumis melo TaxID=3656 RepID=A0A9I9DUB6_CUCME
MEVEHIPSPDSPLMTPIQISPTQSEIIRDNLVTLVDSEEEEGKSDKWIGKKKISEKLFKKQLITWLKDNNLKLAPAFDNIVSTFTTNMGTENNIEIGYKPLGSNSSPRKCILGM